MRTRRTLEAKLTAALVIAAAVCPTGAYAKTDLSAPTGSEPEVHAAAPRDLRSPDARDAAQAAAVPQDLRSPDTRDAAAAVSLAHGQISGLSRSDVSPARPAPSVSDGFEWSDAGIGAASMFALLTAAGCMALLVSRRRQRTRTT